MKSVIKIFLIFILLTIFLQISDCVERFERHEMTLLPGTNFAYDGTLIKTDAESTTITYYMGSTIVARSSIDTLTVIIDSSTTITYKWSTEDRIWYSVFPTRVPIYFFDGMVLIYYLDEKAPIYCFVGTNLPITTGRFQHFAIWLGQEWKIYTKDNKFIANNIGTEEDKIWTEDFYFVLGADPQFGEMQKMYPNPEIKETVWEEDMKLAETAVEKINKLNPKPKFFIICGDFTKEYPGKNREIRDRQVSDFKRIFSKVDPNIPLICVSGNHDVGHRPTTETISLYRSTYGDDYFSFWAGGVLFIVLNSQYYRHPEEVQELALQQEEWLDEELQNAARHRIVCFIHMPFFVNEATKGEEKYIVPLERRMKLLEKLHNGGVRIIFSGHYHRNAEGMYKDTEMVVNSAIGATFDNSSGLRLVYVKKNEITHRYFTFDEFPTQPEL